MIRINLLRRRTPSYAMDAKKSGGDIDLSGMFKSKSGFGGMGKNLVPILTVFGIPLALGYGASLGLDHYLELRKNEMQGEANALNAEKIKIDNEISRLSGFERKRDEIEGNLRSIRGKMEVLERLLSNRDAPTKAMIHLSQSIPASAWLMDFNYNEAGFEMRGGAMDPSFVTDFVTRLQKSVYFSNVQLREAASVDASSDKVNFSLSGSP